MFLRKSCFEFRFPLNTFYLFQVTNISFRYTTEFEYSLGLYRNIYEDIVFNAGQML